MGTLAVGTAGAQEVLPRLEEGATVSIRGNEVAIESSPMMQVREFPIVGPPAGTLLLAGGGDVTGIFETFVSLLGDTDAPVVLIPTANCRGESFGPDSREVTGLRAAGLTRVSMVHTRDPTAAGRRKSLRRLRAARGVWFSGGGAECLVAPYLHTAVHVALREVLDRGGIVAGTSAGAVAMGAYFEIPLGDPVRQGRLEFEGFGLLRNVTLAAHVDTRPAEFDETIVPVVRDLYPGLLGIGLPEATAIVVRGDVMEVAGPGTVLVYDGTKRAVAGRVEIPPGGHFLLDERRRPKQDGGG